MIAETHPVTPEELMAYRDGEHSAARTEFLSAHVQSCSQCQEMDRVLRSASQTLASWTVAPVVANPAFEERLSEAAGKSDLVRSSFSGGRLAGFGRRHPIFSAAFGAAAVVAIGFGMVMPSARRPFPNAAMATTESLAMQKSREESVFTNLPNAQATEDYVSENPEMAKEKVDVAAAQRQALVERLERAQISSNLENSATTVAPLSAPMIARTVSLSLVVKNFEASRQTLDAILARHHGYAASLSANTQQNTARSLQASLRIPAGELGSAVNDLKALGHIENESQSGEEVTQQHADLVVRLKNSYETERRLQAILVQRTGKISDVLSVEQEIARVRCEIEQMEAQQKSIEHRVDFATIDLNMGEEYKAQLGSPSPSIATRFHNALVAGYRSALESVIGVTLFFAEYGPSALIWVALLAPVVWFLRRRWTRAATAA
jgi:anti-sigma factor RsiW